MSRWQDREAKRLAKEEEWHEEERRRFAFEALPWDQQIEQAQDFDDLKDILIRFVRHHDLE